MLLAVPFLSVIFLLPLVGLVLGIMTAVDVSKYPEWAFGQTGASKTVWQVLPVVLGLFCFGIGGIVMYFMWTSSRRAQVAQTAQAAGAQYGYGAPPPGWGAPPPAPPGWQPPGAPGGLQGSGPPQSGPAQGPPQSGPLPGSPQSPPAPPAPPVPPA